MKPLARAVVAAALLLFVPRAASARPSVTELLARDNPGDGGGTIRITWEPIDSPGLTGYRIMRRAEGDTWERIAFRGPMAARYSDDEATDGVKLQYRLDAVYADTAVASPASAWVASSAQWFNPNTIPAVVGTVIFTFLIVYATYHARRGRNLFIRRIAGLDAVEEALGRATEMGRVVLFVPGLSYIDDVATIAAINILSEIAKETAKFGTPLTVPVADPIVYTVARETVKESYTTAGRPDAFDPGSVYFVTNQQFAFAAAVDGIMTREKPATNFFIGMFWAESLILAETGATTGAVQIAGTDAVSQLPFFITACDYTLIGEELYAASAYISREPLLLGSLKGQDYSKFIIVSLVVLGTLLALAFSLDTPSWF
jgi:hypothetical protein